MNLTRVFFVLLFATMFLVACKTDTSDETQKENEQNETGQEQEEAFESNQASPYDAIVSYTGMIYFGQGTYEEFTKLYVNPEDAPSESTFDNFRDISKPAERFGVTDLEAFKENLKVEEIDDSNAIAYHVRNAEDGIEKATQKWEIVLKEDQWYLAD